MATSAERQTEEHERVTVCLACGTPLEDPFLRLGSLRCNECRSIDRPLDERLVDGWRENGAPLH